jgi:hypothetical protein
MPVKREAIPNTYYLWRLYVLERDKYVCQCCFEYGNCAHHIKPFIKYPLLRLEVSNGKTLCVDCHKKEHAKK